jgi:GMP synthase-like glutamine amidotransferase
MKPIRIYRHLNRENPGYLGEFLDHNQVAWELVCVDDGAIFQHSLDDVSGLVFMGAAVSVNDPLHWVEEELELIRRAHEQQVPMMGICFGAQLISKALGGDVSRGEGMEIGWYPLYRISRKGHTDWLDGLPIEFDTFHWHADTFSMPPGAKPLLMSECYKNQGFVLGDHLGMQFHLEMTEEMVESWIGKYGSDLEIEFCCVQSAKEIRDSLSERIERLHRIADVIYGNRLKRVRAAQQSS